MHSSTVSVSKIKKENKNSFAYAFKQQVMKAWQPVPTINSTMLLFSLLSKKKLLLFLKKSYY